MSNRSLLLHIGSGKTGSSSIQKTFEDNREVLQAAGFRYLGIMLENATEGPKPGWRFRGGANRFFHQGDDDARMEELYQVLAAEVAKTPDGGTLVWSNEWMFGRHTRLLPVFKRLQDEGVDLRIVCYLRRHDRFAMSAYKQWAIKNKTNEGRILRFRDWAVQADTLFYPKIKPWVDEFGKQVMLYNYEEVGDIVAHFIKVAGMPALSLAKDNISPRNEMLALWGIFNNRLEAVVPPHLFERFLRYTLPHPERAEMPPLAELLPDDDELRQFQRRHLSDAGEVNALLMRSGQPPLNVSSTDAVSGEVDPWKMTCLMASMIFSLGEKVRTQGERIAALEARLAEPEPEGASEPVRSEG